MLQSMTGYGKSEVNSGKLKVSIELKTLNSKSLDLFVKISSRYKNKEIELRKIIQDRIQRGKIDFIISIENLGTETNYQINQSIIKNYVSSLKSLDIEGSDLEFLQMAVKMPEVFTSQDTEISQEEWKSVESALHVAIDHVIEFRINEGKALQTVLKLYAENILKSLSEIEKYEKERIETIKERIEKQLSELQIQYDDQRFHQEMIYYIEKLDICEEKIRLEQHCKYFFETLEKEEPVGKKIGFITQEMGREINTIGSKANHSEIQKYVVLMKEELEKIKEQANNIL